MPKKWYVLRVQSGKEDQVRETLDRRIQAEELDKSITRVLVPSERISEIRGGQKRVRERKIYPGYIMVEIETEEAGRIPETAWFTIRETGGIGDFLGDRTGPTPMSKRDVDKILGEAEHKEEAPKLNEAGRIKARWIATRAPRHHRALYVSRAETAEETVARVAAVQEYVAQVVPEGEKPAVIETDLDALGWPAAQVDSIDRQWQESTPAPRLPETQSSSVSAQ